MNIKTLIGVSLIAVSGILTFSSLNKKKAVQTKEINPDEAEAMRQQMISEKARENQRKSVEARKARKAAKTEQAK